MPGRQRNRQLAASLLPPLPVESKNPLLRAISYMRMRGRNGRLRTIARRGEREWWAIAEELVVEEARGEVR